MGGGDGSVMGSGIFLGREYGWKVYREINDWSMTEMRKGKNVYMFYLREEAVKIIVMYNIVLNNVEEFLFYGKILNCKNFEPGSDAPVREAHYRFSSNIKV